MTTIGIFVFPGVEELDFVGPWEVLRAWERVWPDDGARVVLLAREEGTIQCAKGLRVIPEATWASGPALDVLVLPGGMGTNDQLGNEDYRGWLRGLAGGGTLMTSVCTGSLVFADAGLLDGRPATTHWASVSSRAWATTSRSGPTTVTSTTGTS
jgi:transcriptional regulator GlxA family with amidase domain